MPIAPEAIKDQIIEALKRIVLKGSELRPLILAYEDLHWMDKGSEDVLKNVLESIPGARVLLIFTYRSEFVHAWGGKSYHSQVTLNRLSNREVLVMVTYFLGTEDVETDLEELILEKAEGVPFFIEEFVKSLIEGKIIERKNNTYLVTKDLRDVTIPSTIRPADLINMTKLSKCSNRHGNACWGFQRIEPDNRHWLIYNWPCFGPCIIQDNWTD
jgi:predicted ATPase